MKDYMFHDVRSKVKSIILTCTAIIYTSLAFGQTVQPYNPGLPLDPLDPNTNTTDTVFCYPVEPEITSSMEYVVGGIENSLDVSPTGAATYTVPISVPQGHAGMEPSLSLTYDSQGGMGLAGWGCNIGGLSVITRVPRDIFHDGQAHGIKHDNTDAFALDGQRLIYYSGTEGANNCVYTVEGNPYTKVTLKGSGSTMWFEVKTNDGKVYRYGSTEQSRQTYYVPSVGTHVNAWYISRATDRLGNYITYNYGRNERFVYPTSIQYGGNTNAGSSHFNTISFEYDSLGTASQLFRLEGVAGRMNKRLRTVKTKTNGNIFRQYDLTYNTTSDGTMIKFPRLTSISEENGEGERLPPLQIDWRYLPIWEKTEFSFGNPRFNGNANLNVKGNNYIAADLSGDGISDIIEIIYTDSLTGTGVTPRNYLKEYLTVRNSDGTLSFNNTRTYNIPENLSLYGDRYASSQILGDYNGDGYCDIFIPKIIMQQNGVGVVSLSIVDGMDILNPYSLIGNPTMITHFLHNLYISGEDADIPLFTTADFNNDGRSDFVLLERENYNNSYGCHLFLGTQEIDSTYLDVKNNTLQLSHQPKDIFVSDFNGNGMTDLLVVTNNGYTIFWNTEESNTIPFDNDHTSSGTSFHYVKYMKTGDFNGDGLMDFFTNANVSGNYYFQLNKGDGTFETVLACTSDLRDYSTSKDDNRFSILVHDIDNDGKSDVLLVKSMYVGGVYMYTGISWLISDGRNLTEARRAYTHNEDDALTGCVILGDFLGNGTTQVVNYGATLLSDISTVVSPSFHLYSTPSFSAATGRVKSITDSYSNKTDIVYKPLTDNTVYTKGSGATFPVVDVCAPLSVVSSMRSGNGAYADITTKYTYGGLKTHVQGRGLIGYSSTTVLDSLANKTISTTVGSLDAAYFQPLSTTTTTTIGLDTATVVNTYALSTLYSNSNFIVYPQSSVSSDFDSITQTTTYTFDINKGRLTSEVVTENTQGMYRRTDYGFCSIGNVWMPSTVTKTQKHSHDSSAFTDVTRYEYYGSTGLPHTIVEHDGSSQPLTTLKGYDDYGNLLADTVSGQGISTVTTYYTYDSTNRFVTQTTTSPASAVHTYTYDIWGNRLTETDATVASSPITTQYQYDGFGRMIREISPTGLITQTDRGWGSSYNQKFFTVTRSQGEPWTKTWYDRRGRETFSESYTTGDVHHTKTTTYNALGQVTNVAAAQGPITSSASYTYDVRGRVLSETLSTGSATSYAYSVQNNNRKVTAVTNGRTYIKTYDAWGNVVKSTDPASSVQYVYGSHGQPTTINAASSYTYIQYDDLGRRTRLSDPDAGVTTYTYNALGQIMSSTDARNITTTNSYDNLNRLVQKAVGNQTISYTYGTAGNALGRIVRQSMGSDSIVYEYDTYGRVTKETRYYGNSANNFIYTYNNRGQVATTKYPDNLTLSYLYDAYGTKMQTLRDTTSLWRLESTDGQTQVELLGTNIRRTTTHDQYGNLSGIAMTRKVGNNTTTLHSMSFTHNPVTGNLTARTNMIQGNENETFTYDTSDRLTGWTAEHISQTFQYESNGCISWKTGVGNYVNASYWGGEHPHAVMRVANTDGIVKEGITTAFNNLNRVSMIDNHNSGNFVTYTYGPDMERWQADIYDYTAPYQPITRRYMGDYETEARGPGMSSRFHYLEGGVMLISTDEGALQPYYAFTDNLGSYTRIYDNSGNEVYHAEYDPWGKQTVMTNTIHFFRGYTGHEMLMGWNIINMNGRLYDPVLGRFLSPDNYVQLPDYSQSYNRYTYCLNNPLKYTDPDGEWFGLDDLLIAGVSFGAGYLSNSISTGKWGWSSVKTGLISAGTAWIGYNTAGVATAGQGITSATWNQVINIGLNTVSSTILPSFSIPITNHFSIGFSIGLGYGDNGLTFGANRMLIYSNGEATIGIGEGFGSNYHGVSINIGVGDFSAGYALTSFSATKYNGQNIGAQSVGTISLSYKDVSFSLANDLFADGYDRWRSSAAELSIKNLTIGTYVLNNWGMFDSNDDKILTAKDPYIGSHPKGLGKWKNGQTYSAPFWIGFKQGNTISRMGISAKVVQSLTQNLVHSFMDTPYFLDYNYFIGGMFSYRGYNNPYSMWNY